MLLKQSDKVKDHGKQPYTKGQAHVSRMLTMARIQPVALVCQMALHNSRVDVQALCISPTQLTPHVVIII